MNPSDNMNTHLVAVSALTSPLWLHSMSDMAQTILPIAGLIWLVIQAVVYLYTTFWKKPDHDRKD